MKKDLCSVLLYDHQFAQDKENTYPPCFNVLSMSPHSDHLGMVQNGRFAVSFPGNWHCLHPQNVSDFRLEFNMAENLHNTPSFLIYFRAVRKDVAGLYLELDYTGTVFFGILKNTHYEVLQKKKLKDPSFGIWSISVQKDKIRIVCNGKNMASFTIPEKCPYKKGIIALDAAMYCFGAKECHIDNLKLYLPETAEKKLTTIKVPMIYGPHGVATPYTFTVERTAAYGCEKWSVTLNGGPGKDSDHPEPRCMNAEIMDRPYCRALDADGNELFRVVIANGRAGSFSLLRATYGVPDFIYPVSRDAVVDMTDVKYLAFGYEYYESEAMNSLAGGPAEILCDRNGKTISFRKVYENGACDAVLESPRDKAIVKMIPKDIPDYANALEYAKVNHYFLEGEDVRFRGLCVPCEATDGDFVLENAYREPIKKFHKKANTFFSLGKLAPGVYHLHAVMKRNDLVLGEVRNAFEVMPDDESTTAQKIAGYPDIYPDTFLADYSHHFHPWGTAVVDVTHYIGTGAEYAYTSDYRPLKLLKVYHREWTSRIQPGPSKEKNIEVVKKYAKLIRLCIATVAKTGRYYLHMPDLYTNDEWIREMTKKFAGRELTFEEIYPERWTEWLDFIAPYCREQLKESHAVPPTAKAANFLTFATYGSIYKGPNYCRLLGMDLRNDRLHEIMNGFAIMEDYPYSSRYPLSRATWQFTSIAMEDPALRTIPQVWGLNAETLDGRVVYGHPPFGISVTPPKFFYTRFMELLYGTAHFDGKEFRYWAAYGLLHSSTWTSDMFTELLRLYGLYRDLKPLTPLRTPAYVYSRAACDAHEYFYEKNERMVRGGSMVNTAEEFAGYLYEMARKDGQAHGFQTRMEYLKDLKASQVSLLVLPPLKGVPEAELKQIRRLHKAGVNLLCSEDAASLADLFDVDHADVLLERKGKKLLTLKNNGKAKAAFFTIAPSMQKRSIDRTGGAGQKALDPEINRAAMDVLRLLGDYEVTATNGAAVTPFLGTDGHTYAFVAENTWPDHGGAIHTDVYYKGKLVSSEFLDRFESKLIRLD